MKSPGLVFLATECVVARHYLNIMLKLDIMPERIVYLGFVAPKRSLIRNIYLNSRRLLSILIKGRKKKKVLDKSEGASGIASEINESVNKWIKSSGFFELDFSGSTMEMLDNAGLEYDSMQVESINSDSLIHFVKKKIKQKYALFVSGGILRKGILNTGLKFVHIHPGYVPYVRGSDCMLWSALVNTNVGMSCFFLNEGIDAGDILFRHEYPLPQLVLPVELKGFENSDFIYNIILESLDPLYRADMLRKLLEEEPDLSKWKAQKQDKNEGKFYYHPHKLIRDKALKLFFK